MFNRVSARQHLTGKEYTMRHSRLSPMTGLFFNTGDRYLKTVDESFDYSRDYLSKVTQPMLENERLAQKHHAEAPKVQQPAPRNNIQGCL